MYIHTQKHMHSYLYMMFLIQKAKNNYEPH